MGKHCLTQHEPLEFHLPPLRARNQEKKAEKQLEKNESTFTPQSWAGIGLPKRGISRGHCINLLPATKLRSAEHLHFGLKILFASGRPKDPDSDSESHSRRPGPEFYIVAFCYSPTKCIKHENLLPWAAEDAIPLIVYGPWPLELYFWWSWRISPQNIQHFFRSFVRLFVIYLF